MYIHSSFYGPDEPREEPIYNEYDDCTDCGGSIPEIHKTLWKK